MKSPTTSTVPVPQLIITKLKFKWDKWEILESISKTWMCLFELWEETGELCQHTENKLFYVIIYHLVP